jgi:uncharacterized protein YciI
MPYFFCRLNPPRPSFATDMNPDEAALMRAHVKYWEAFFQSGEAVIFGPVGDSKGPWGLGILEVASKDEAEALTSADPVITAGIGMKYEVHPMMSAVVRKHADASVTI